MRTFSEIQVGMALSFAFEGRRFWLASRDDDPDVAELLRLGTDIDLSFYKTEMWRRDFDVTAEEWAALKDQFPAAIAGTREVIRQSWIAREERDQQRAEEARLAAIERELRRQEKRIELNLGDADIVLVERPGQFYLDLPHRNYWEANIRKPISAALHDMLVTEIGGRETERYDDVDDDYDEDEDEE